MKRRAFTIAETMITLTIFSIISMISVNVLYNANRTSKSVKAQVFLYSEAQALMNQVADAIERNAVDYEGYYEVLNEFDNHPWDFNYYGVYGQSFYDLGADGEGTECADRSGPYPDACPTGLPDYTTADTNEGVHPSNALNPQQSNAFCQGSASCEDVDHHVQPYLLLINEEGDEKTIIAREQFNNDPNGDHYLSMVRMLGSDDDNDGTPDSWTCLSRYTCTRSNTPLKFDLITHQGESAGQKNFMPVTPDTISVSDFYVIVSPLEDPYRAFAEAEVQMQPQVTVVMTVTLSDNYGARLLGDVPSVTLQRTVSTGVYSEVVSYE